MSSADWHYRKWPIHAQRTASLSGHTHCGGESATTTTVGNNVPCAFASDFISPTDFGQSRRNQMFGPNYTDTAPRLIQFTGKFEF